MSKKIRTMCHDCHSKCGVILEVKGNEIISVQGDPNHPISEGSLCTKAYSAQEIHAHPDRLKYPLHRSGARGEGKWKRISWDEAFDLIMAAINKTLEEYGPHSVITAQGTGRASNAWHYRLQSTIGEPGFALAPTHVCLLPFLAQTHVTWGRMFHPYEAGDFRNSRCNVCWGSNPVRTRQHTALRMLDSKRNGGKLIVIDPVFRDIAAKADVFLAIRPGTDSMLALGLSNLIIQNKTYGEELLVNWTNAPFLINVEEERLLRESDVFKEADINLDNYVVWDKNTNALAVWDPEREAYDKEDVYPLLDDEFLVTMTDGTEAKCPTVFNEYKKFLAQYTPEKVEEITWIPRDKIIEAYEMMIGNKPCILSPYLGACMMVGNAIQSGRAITILQILLDPPVDEPGGLFFNPVWDFTFDPKITLADKVPGQHLRLGYDKYPMYTQVYASSNWPASIWEAVLTEQPWPVKVIISIASDFLGCYEAPQRVHDALMSDNLELMVSMDYWMTPTAELADIVLPAAHWSERVSGDEETLPDPGCVTISQICVQPPGEARDDWFFFRELGRRINPEWWPYESSEDMWMFRLKTFYDVNPDMTFEEAAKIGYIESPTTGKNRIYRQHEKGLIKFKTSSHKIEIYSEAMPVYGYESPLPTFAEPFESPVSTPEVFKEYPMVLTTGSRDFAFYHSAWTNLPSQRILEPWPYAEVNEGDARNLQISEGEWIYVESPRGRIKVKARVSKGVLKGVVSLPRQNYKDSCEELGLPGFGWDGANPNILIPTEGSDPGFGCTPMRGTLCRLVKVEIGS